MNAGGQPAPAASRREIGPIGTTTRVVLGLIFVVVLGIPGGVTTVHGQYRYTFDVLSVILGAVVFPAVALGLHWFWVRRRSAPLRETGPVASAINFVVLLVLFLMPWYAPRIYFIATGAALFYGASMVLAAARGRAGCEVTAVSNWVLHREDQVGCPVFTPIDSLEHHPKSSPQT